MNEFINAAIASGLIMSPIVTILVEAVKKMNIVSSKWLPIVSLIIGMLFATLLTAAHAAQGWQGLIISGIIAGAVASGLYDSIAANTTKTEGG